MCLSVYFGNLTKSYEAKDHLAERIALGAFKHYVDISLTPSLLVNVVFERPSTNNCIWQLLDFISDVVLALFI